MRALLALPGRHVFFLLVAAAVLMASIDSTIVSVALPQLTEQLQAPLSWVSWTLTVYQLVQLIMNPLVGKLSDSFGRREVFLSCVVIFTVSSILCGLAPNVYVLIGFRALQAIGGGGLLPSAVGIVAERYRSGRAQAVGLISSVMPMGSIIGPNLGGLVLQTWDWRGLFWINVPIGVVIVAGVLRMRADAETRSAHRSLSFDALGLFMYAGAVVGLMLGMTVIANDPTEIHNPLIWGLFGGSIALVALFIRHVRTTPDPVMEYTLLARRPFWPSNLYNLLFGSVTMGFYSFIPYYAVVRYGLSPFESGAVLTPRAVVVVVTSILASVYLIRLGYRMPMIVGMLLVASTLLLLAQGWTSVQVGPVTISGFILLSLILAIGGVGMGLSNPASNNASLDLAPDKAAAITGIRNTFRLTGATLSISGIVLALSFFPNQADGLSTIFIALSAVVLVAVPLVLMIPDMAREARKQEPLDQPAGPAMTETSSSAAEPVAPARVV